MLLGILVIYTLERGEASPNNIIPDSTPGPQNFLLSLAHVHAP